MAAPPTRSSATPSTASSAPPSTARPRGAPPNPRSRSRTPQRPTPDHLPPDVLSALRQAAAALQPAPLHALILAYLRARAARPPARLHRAHADALAHARDFLRREVRENEVLADRLVRLRLAARLVDVGDGEEGGGGGGGGGGADREKDAQRARAQAAVEELPWHWKRVARLEELVRLTDERVEGMGDGRVREEFEAAGPVREGVQRMNRALRKEVREMKDRVRQGGVGAAEGMGPGVEAWVRGVKKEMAWEPYHEEFW